MKMKKGGDSYGFRKLIVQFLLLFIIAFMMFGSDFHPSF